MKKIYLLLALVISTATFAQTQGITYQAVILNPEGQNIPGNNNQRAPLANKNICIRFNIMAGSILEYQETHLIATDEFGMVNLVIGNGTPVGGSASIFSGIVWSGASKNLKVDVDLRAFCSNYTEISNQPFTAVPYALYAANSGTPGATGPQGPAGPAGPRGLTGAIGPQGAIGLTGATGPQGPIGLTGATGPQGSIGLTGAAGPQGIAGTNGAIGLTGATGPQGPIGLTGAAGPQGIAGTNGAVGATGPQGAIGLTGATGPQGAIGLTGPQGPQGIAGINGTNGADGATGPAGPQGPIGLTGALGPQGVQGIAGTNGTNGVDGKNTLVKTTTEAAGVNCVAGGTKVEVGLDANSNGILDATEVNAALTKYICNGAVGATGAQGAQGIQGVAGATGPQGPVGANGLSAYDIAVQNGYTGTETQWLSTTAGAAGTNGVDGKNTLVKTTIEPIGANCVTGGTKVEVGLDANSNGVLDVSEVNATLTKYVCNGAVGSQGIQGVAGSNGATGPQGIAGTNGTNGANGATGPQGPTGPIGLTGAAGTNGTNGNTVLNGTIAPTAGLGVNGDFYINTTTKTIFGPKAAGTWPVIGTSLVGASGAAGTNGTNGINGNTVLNGTIAPTAGIGVNGDFYINTSTKIIFGPKAAGAWPATGTALVGATGPAGAQGIQGVAGATGATGPQGPAGSNASITMGTISGTSSANGATLTSGVLNLTPADATNGGVVTNSTQTIAGAKTFTNAVAGNNTATSTIAGFAANMNAQTGATYTLTAADNGKIITFTNACTVTVPNSLFAGFNCFLLQAGAGQVTMVGATGVTVNNRRALTKTAGTYAIATILALNATTFISSGDMSN